MYVTTLILYISAFFVSLRLGKASPCAWLLNGLTRYEVWTPPSAKDGVDGKQGNKQGAKHRKPPKPETSEGLSTQDMLSGMESPIARTLNLQEVAGLPMFSTFDGVCNQCIGILTQWALSEFMSRALGRVSSPILSMLTMIVVVFLTIELVKLLMRSVVTIDGRNNRTERQAIICLMAVLALLFMVGFALVPTWIVDARLDEGAQGLAELGESVQRAFARLAAAGKGDSSEGAPPPPVPAVPADNFDELSGEFDSDGVDLTADVSETLGVPAPAAVLSLLFVFLASILAGVHGALVLMPVVRFARSVRACLYPPRWASGALGRAGTLDSFSQGPLVKALAAAAVVAPPLALLLWVKPVAREMLGLSVEGAIMAQGVALVLAGLLQLLAFRPAMQGYLNTGLVQWYSHKHSVTHAGQSTRASLAHATNTYVVMNNTAVMAARIALQLVLPPLLLLLLGCLICDSVALGRQEPEMEDEELQYHGAVLSFMMAPRRLVWSLASVLGLAALLLQSTYSLTTLALLRNGVVL